MSKVDDFARLTCLNSMLSLLSGGPTYQSEQISAVLRFLRAAQRALLLDRLDGLLGKRNC